MIISGIFFAILAVILAIVSQFTNKEIPTGKYIYQVTISDEVNFVEFNEKYEIIDQEGKIYTIEEKEN